MVIHLCVVFPGHLLDCVTSIVRYVSKRYGIAVVIFDGYQDGPTTKDATGFSTFIDVTADMIFQSKEDFINNEQNKQKIH